MSPLIYNSGRGIMGDVAPAAAIISPVAASFFWSVVVPMWMYYVAELEEAVGGGGWMIYHCACSSLA